MSEMHVAHTKPLSRLRSLPETYFYIVIVQSAIHWLYSFLFPGFGEFEEGLTHLINYSCRISRNCFDKEIIYYDRAKILFTLKYMRNLFFLECHLSNESHYFSVQICRCSKTPFVTIFTCFLNSNP